MLPLRGPLPCRAGGRRDADAPRRGRPDGLGDRGPVAAPLLVIFAAAIPRGAILSYGWTWFAVYFRGWKIVADRLAWISGASADSGEGFAHGGEPLAGGGEIFADNGEGFAHSGGASTDSGEPFDGSGGTRLRSLAPVRHCSLAGSACIGPARHTPL